MGGIGGRNGCAGPGGGGDRGGGHKSGVENQQVVSWLDCSVGMLLLKKAPPSKLDVKVRMLTIALLFPAKLKEKFPEADVSVFTGKWSAQLEAARAVALRDIGPEAVG